MSLLSKIYQIGRNVRSNGSRTESASVKDGSPPMGEPRGRHRPMVLERLRDGGAIRGLWECVWLLLRLCNKWGILDKIQAYCSCGMSREAFDGAVNWLELKEREMSGSQSGQFPDWVLRPITWQCPVRSGQKDRTTDLCHENIVISGGERSRAVRRSWTGSSSQRDSQTLFGQTFWQLQSFLYKYIVWRMFPTLFLNWNIKQNLPTDHIWYLLRRVDSGQTESEDDNIIRKSSLPETRVTWEDPFNRLRIMRNSSRYKSKWWDSSPLSISCSPPIPPQSCKIVSSPDCLCEPRAGHVLERKELIRTCFRH